MNLDTGKYWDAAWNVAMGCSPVGAGCANCWAAGYVHRFHKSLGVTEPGPNGPRFNGRVSRLYAPFAKASNKISSWKKPRVVAVNWLGDIGRLLPREQSYLFNVFSKYPQHVFLVLTKHPRAALEPTVTYFGKNGLPPLPNVWLGVSCWDQESADTNLGELIQVACSGGRGADWNLWVSYEPALGPVDFTNIEYRDEWGVAMRWNALAAEAWVLESSSPSAYANEVDGVPRLGQVVMGGENGTHARPLHPDWTRAVRDQCAADWTPFFFKGWGEWIVPDDGEPSCRVCGCTDYNTECEYTGHYCGECWWVEPGLCSSCQGKDAPEGDRPVKYRRMGRKAAGRELDGRTHDGLAWVPEEVEA